MLKKSYRRTVVNTAGIKKKKSLKFRYSLCSTTYGFILEKELEATRRVIVKQLQRLYKIENFISIDFPITKKGLQSRMGKGKGNFAYNIGFIKRGTVLFEVLCYTESELVFKALMQAKKKLSLHSIVLQSSKYVG